MVAASLFLLLLADLSGPRLLGPLDEALAGDRLPILGRALSVPGDTLVAVPALLIGAWWCLRQGRVHVVPLLVGVPIAGHALVWSLKLLLGRIRPDGTPWAFPSGHAHLALAAWIALAWWCPRRPRPWVGGAVVLALLVGIGRIVSGRHWPTDVAAGWALAAALFGAAVWLKGASPPSATLKPSDG